MITTYLGNMKGIKYLYIIAHGDANADRDMYLVDYEENPTTEFVFKSADEEMYKDKGQFKEKYGENYR